MHLQQCSAFGSCTTHTVYQACTTNYVSEMMSSETSDAAAANYSTSMSCALLHNTVVGIPHSCCTLLCRAANGHGLVVCNYCCGPHADKPESLTSAAIGKIHHCTMLFCTYTTRCVAPSRPPTACSDSVAHFALLSERLRQGLPLLGAKLATKSNVVIPAFGMLPKHFGNKQTGSWKVLRHKARKA